jgi:long-subunit acyl-CoA synthetase (AMP-forming)
MTVATHSALAAVAAGRPPSGHRVTFYQPGGTVTLDLEELERRARQLGWHLRRLGVQPGDRIGIVARNRLEWVLLDLACIKLKAVSAGFEPGKFDAPAALAERYGLRFIFTDRPVPDDPRVVPFDALLPALADAPADPVLPPIAYRPDDVVTIKFTSGSTGEPKGLGARAGSVDSSLAAVQTLFAHGPGDTLFVFLPLSLLQQRYWIYSALAFGHDVVVATYELAFHALKREQPTVVMGVPGFFEALRKQIDGPEGDPAERARAVLGGRIRYLWTGSAPASPDVLSFFERCGMPIFEGYGLNETCIATKNALGAHRRGSVGRPLPGKRVHLDDEGVVIVSSDQPVNTRYLFSEPGASEAVFLPDGSVRTGDLGRIDEDGYLYILGRADDVAVLRNGRNVFVRPVEERLKRCPQIEDCIVVGFGRDHLAAIVCASGGEAVRAAIEAHIAACNAAGTGDERVGGFILADEPFSIENGLLTSQYKPRRRAILARYHDPINRLYGEPG